VHDWNSFLLAFDERKNQNDSGETYFMPLLEQGVLAVEGPDAGKFLQGQVTCDTRELEQYQTLLGAQCNLKGRMLLCFRALQVEPEKILLRMNKELISNAFASLSKYIVFSKAKMVDRNQDYRFIGICGSKAAQILLNLLNIEIENDNEWKLTNENIVIRINQNRYECWLTTNNADSISMQLSKLCHLADQRLWTLLNIQAGLGDITTATADKFTPQAINLQLVNGVNFRKGCYTGQEIVARLHYRGALKRHMYRFEFTLVNDEPPTPGMELFNSENKAVGEIVIAAHKSTSLGELLANVLDEELQNLYLPNNPQKLRLLPLPYAITTSNDTL
jgi:tRNA-modifying protein YgfZ